MNLTGAIKESLWEYMLTLPNSSEAQILYAMLFAGLLGMSAHYVVNWLKSNGGESTLSLSQYCAIQGWKRISLSAISYVGTAITCIGSNVFIAPSGEFVGWANVIVFSLGTSFGIDAVVHRNARVPWTEEQRAARPSDGK